MPITAKFSKKFYDTLGHDIADEMVDWFNRADETYRTDLYRINDLNFDRFEAKVEQRFVEFEAKVDQRFAESDRKVDRRFAEFEAKVATKSDLRDLRDEFMGALVSQRDEFVGRLASQRDELVGCLASQRDLADFRTELAERLGALQTDLHRRMFLYWGGLVGVVIAASILG